MRQDRPAQIAAATPSPLPRQATVQRHSTALNMQRNKSRVKSNTPMPSSIRRHSKHPAAGSNLFRRWLALIRRHPDMVCVEWKSSFDTFCRDVSLFQPSSRMTRTNPTKPWSANNFTWMTTKEAAAHIHGKPLTAFGKSFNSHTELAEAYGISVSTLKIASLNNVSATRKLSRGSSADHAGHLSRLGWRLPGGESCSSPY